ncbi:hypothetical protein [Oscillatoria sp. HE19RPO]|uniref:hypothetical protein n=1 Tax=Oscillatoria sp. HE19RPO TaxID=2954806 RepID=UPI0020C45AC1|nr:hypothetical protein [Oscillatoria sp. HE19RPO]
MTPIHTGDSRIAATGNLPHVGAIRESPVTPIHTGDSRIAATGNLCVGAIRESPVTPIHTGDRANRRYRKSMCRGDSGIARDSIQAIRESPLQEIYPM